MVMVIIILIFAYIGIDIAKTEPSIKSDIENVKKSYDTLSNFLSIKLPQIDSTLKIQADQISRQETDIRDLNVKIRKISDNTAPNSKK